MSSDTSPVPEYPGLLRLDDTVHLVVGAGRGIGRQTAHALHQAGAHVLCLDNDVERAKEVATQVEGTPLVADVLDRAAVQTTIDDAVRDHGALHGVVDIVGMARFRALTDATDEDWAWQFDIVLTHARLLLQATASTLANTRGTFTMVSSVAGLTGAQGNGPYAAAKAALISLIRTASVELAPQGVRVNSVAPSIVLTPRMTELLGTERKQHFVDNTPLGRLAESADIAAAILFLTSPLSSYITGQTLVLDGGVEARFPYPDFV